MVAYITKDKRGLVQLWNNKPEYNEIVELWQAWIETGFRNEVGIDITKNDFFKNSVTFETSPKEIKSI